ncbi:energy transducer TonB [Pseudoalteromonas sp. bablab_jr011]|uniref:energy transducer TonB n=1 Tax=Pseudoalteromonas sp. bablab_jr011 TaxID=2755062 RepID=UPI0028980BA6|nr:energy transducer TonB [Pseudoalteromonas sp. bablab_jr011]
MELWALKRVTKPSYPKVAQMTKKAGSARFIITIDQHGNSKDITFLESFPAGMFISESREALSDWHCKQHQKTASNTLLYQSAKILNHFE